jgi:hypothetical protein
MYHHPQGIGSSYEYSSYPPSYENTQVPQPPLRSMRSTSSHSPHPHPQSQFNAPPSQPSYPAPYTSAPYAMPQPPPPQPQQWTGESWTSYNQSFSPPAPIHEVPFNSGPGRPDSMSAEQRTYASNPDPRRSDDRQAAPPPTSGPSATSQPKRRREKESPTALGVPSALPGLDFVKVCTSLPVILAGLIHETDDSCWTRIDLSWIPVSHLRMLLPRVDPYRTRRWNECCNQHHLEPKCLSLLAINSQCHRRSGPRLIGMWKRSGRVRMETPNDKSLFHICHLYFKISRIPPRRPKMHLYKKGRLVWGAMPRLLPSGDAGRWVKRLFYYPHIPET